MKYVIKHPNRNRNWFTCDVEAKGYPKSNFIDIQIYISTSMSGEDILFSRQLVHSFKQWHNMLYQVELDYQNVHVVLIILRNHTVLFNNDVNTSL